MKFPHCATTEALVGVVKLSEAPMDIPNRKACAHLVLSVPVLEQFVLVLHDLFLAVAVFGQGVHNLVLALALLSLYEFCPTQMSKCYRTISKLG